MNKKKKVVWIGTLLGDATTDDFENFFLDSLGYHVEYEEEFKVQGGYYNGLTCIVFGICSKEIPKFALFRLTTNDMKWWEDFRDNNYDCIPEEIILKYN